MKTKARTSKARGASRSNGHAPTKAKTVRNRQPAKLETPYDRIKHLSGILKDCPPGLSTDPKYMEGYGK